MAHSSSQSPKLRATALVLALTVLVGAALIFDVEALLGEVILWVSAQGERGPLLFIAFYVVTCVFPLPGFILTYSAGAIFGVPLGISCVSIGATLGATSAFFIGRYFAREWVAAKWVAANPRYAAVDRVVADEGWKIVLLCRLCPFIPFRLSNYFFGTTAIRPIPFILATWLGTLPSATLYVYLGSLAGDAARALASSDERGLTPAEWALYATGLAVLVVIGVFLARIAGRTLSRRAYRA